MQLTVGMRRDCMKIIQTVFIENFKSYIFLEQETVRIGTVTLRLAIHHIIALNIRANILLEISLNFDVISILPHLRLEFDNFNKHTRKQSKG